MDNKHAHLIFKNLSTFSSLDLEDLLELPCYVFVKNKSGNYLIYNNYGALNLGYNNGDEIKNKTDDEIFSKDMASIYRNNDIQVMKNKQALFVREKGILKNFPVIFLSYKVPLYNHDESPTGVLGLQCKNPQNCRI